MKKVLVTALAVGVCVGVSSTSWAEIGSGVGNAVIGGIGISGGGGSLSSAPILYAAEAYSATNNYVTGAVWFVSDSAVIKDGKKATITITFPEEISLSGIGDAPTVTLCNGATAKTISVPSTDVSVQPKSISFSVTSNLGSDTGACTASTGYPVRVNFPTMAGAGWKFINANAEMAKDGYKLDATVKIDATDGTGDEGVLKLAEVHSYLSSDSVKFFGKTYGYLPTVDSKADLLKFVKDSPTTQTDAVNGYMTLTGYSSGTLYAQDGATKFGTQSIDVTLTLNAGSRGFSEAITDIWLDLDGDDKKGDNEGFSTSGDERTLSFKMSEMTGSSDLHFVVDGNTQLPYSAKYKMLVTLGSASNADLMGVSVDAGEWDFNGTILQIPRFEIKGAKCNATLTNTSGQPVEYFADFFTTEKGASKDFTPGDAITGTIPASGTLNIPCNKIIKKVTGNQGTLQFVVKEEPFYITGTYQATKGSSISNDSMTYK